MCWYAGSLVMVGIIIPTCLLSGVAIETGSHDEAEEKTPPPLHAGTALRFLSSYNTKTKQP